MRKSSKREDAVEINKWGLLFGAQAVDFVIEIDFWKERLDQELLENVDKTIWEDFICLTKRDREESVNAISNHSTLS